MPFDSSPDKTPVLPVENPHDIFSLEGLIWWLERQPGETTYNWADSRTCMNARYMESRGSNYADMTYEFFLGNAVVSLMENVGSGFSIGNRTHADNRRTYAAALSRARALAGERR